MTQDSQLDIPVIDISALVSGEKDRDEVAGRIGQACHEWVFFILSVMVWTNTFSGA